jgi:hypothetical protein
MVARHRNRLHPSGQRGIGSPFNRSSDPEKVDPLRMIRSFFYGHEWPES